MASNLENLTIRKLQQLLKAGEVSAVEVTQAYLDNVKNKNSELNAYLEIYDDALEVAKKLDEKKDFNKPLSGVPIAIKDNILVKGKVASAASKILGSYKATYNATVIKKLGQAGAVFLGRTNMDEFAMGSSTENSAYGVTRNPHDTTRVAGGSSGGSAAAVAADLAVAALGSDTGGSIRQPASFCDVVGLKPTYGAVSRYGLIAMASSFDVIGPIAKTVEDAKIMFDVIKGRDPMDSTSQEARSTKSEIQNKKIGVPWKFLEKGVDESVRKQFDENLEKLKSVGYEIVEIDLPHVKYAVPAYYIITPAEVSSNLARYDGVRYGVHALGRDGIDDYFKTRGAGFGVETRRRILLGTYVLSAGYYDAYYNRAVEVVHLIRAEFENIFQTVSAIALPTTPAPPFKIGEKGDDPVKMYLEDIFTGPANLAGLPAISVPPNLQLVAPRFGEEALFDIGSKFSSC